jgi:NTP pyrophosphatase (non-canonical NTP hydrolase)
MNDAIWNEIVSLQGRLFPLWKTRTPRLLYSTALAGESGELCGVITHLEGGGTNAIRYTEAMILEEASDVFIQLVLLLEKSGFNHVDLEQAIKEKLNVLHERMRARGQ